MAAAHRATVTTPTGTCTDCRSHGGPEAGSTIGGYIQLSRTADAAIMIRIAPPIPAAASQVSRRARPGAGPAGSAGVMAWAGSPGPADSVESADPA